jgi:hypothetical protein
VKRIRKVFFVLSLCAALSTVPVFADAGGELPGIFGDVVRNRDFFANPWALWGYEDCILTDAERLDKNRLGVDLIAPSGMEYRAVYDVKTLKIVYSDARVPEKSGREGMRRAGISAADALKLAKYAVEAENRQNGRDLTF